MPSLDWHGLKNFKDFEEFVNVSFFYPNSWTEPKAQDGHINKFISPPPPPKKNLHDFYLYIQILCLWSALCMSNTILTVLWIMFFFKCSTFAFLSFFLSLCCIVCATQNLSRLCSCNENVKTSDGGRAWSRFSSVSCRTVRQRREVLRSFNIHDSDPTSCLIFCLNSCQWLIFVFNLKKLTLCVFRDQIISPCALKYHADQPVWRSP